MNELELVKVQESIRSRLAKVAAEDGRSLAAKNPDRWLHIATKLAQGSSAKSLRDEIGVDHRTVVKVRNEVFDSVEGYRKFQVKEANVNLGLIDYVQGEALEKLAQSGELDLNAAKAIKELGVAGQVLSQRIGRLQGEADVVVETRKAPSLEEVQNFGKRLKAMKKADIVDI